MALATNKTELETLYVEEGLSDSEIARLLGIDRTYVSKLRKEYGIQTNNKSSDTGRLGEVYTILTLLNKGFSVRDMNAVDKTHSFDILVDHNKRLDVKSALLSTENNYKFQFGNKPTSKVKVDDNVVVTKTGRTVKKYHNSCDYIVLVALNENTQTFVIPSNNPLVINKQTISISDLYNSRFDEFRNNWDQLIDS